MVTCVYWSNAYSKGYQGNNKFFIKWKNMWFSGSGIAKWVGNNNVCLLSFLRVWMEGRKDELPLPPHCYFPLNKFKYRATHDFCFVIVCKIRLAVLFTSIRPHLVPIAQGVHSTQFSLHLNMCCYSQHLHIYIYIYIYISITMVLYFLRKKI